MEALFWETLYALCFIHFFALWQYLNIMLVLLARNFLFIIGLLFLVQDREFHSWRELRLANQGFTVGCNT